MSGDDPVFVDGEIRLTFRYTHGIAGERFALGLKNGKFIGSKCSACGRVFLPAKQFCEVCFKEINEFVDIPNRGTVYARTSTPGGDLIAAIEMEGTDTLIYHRVKSEEIDTGSCVKAVFKPPKERKGSITDIEYFDLIK